jgi:hypothetical protein
MRNSIKFTVSIPMKEYDEMEAVRKKAGLTRSAFFLGTFRAWKDARRRENAVRSYIAGYRQTPEDPALAAALAQAAAEILPSEDWT